jgi:glucose-6-phosphate isomerase
MVQLDYTNALDTAVGTHGIPKVAFTKAADSSKHVIEAVEAARVAGGMGFADLPFNDAPVNQVMDFARTHSSPNVLVLGIGGSALGALALDSALSKTNSARRLVVLDNVDPDFMRDELDKLVPKDTIVNVVAKSGGTAETMASFAVVWQWMKDAVGSEKVRERFVVTTDPEKGDLLSIARHERLPTFAVPENVGGRFSVLTPVGTLPAALLGLNIEAVMSGARRTAMQSRQPFERNPALAGAFTQFVLERERRKTVLVVFPYSQALWKFAFWFKQLWGESLGKKVDRRGRDVFYGQTPTAALGVTDQHSQLQLFIEGPNDKSFMFCATKSFRNKLPIHHDWKDFDSTGYLENKTVAELFDAERRATEIALTEAGRPNTTVSIDRVDEEGLGDLIMFSQYMTAYCGEFYDVNAFDQPGVEYGKKLTFAMMGRSGYTSYGKKIEEFRERGRAVIE